MTRAQLAALIKAKYPVYKDTPDEDLVSAVVKKYPTYASQLDPEPKVARQFANTPVDETGKPVEHEPDTYLGGFLKSIKDQVLHATVDNPILKDAAAPPTGGGMDMAKKLAMLALPVTGDVAAAGSNSGNFLQDAGERVAAAARAAGRDTSGVKGVLTSPIRTALKLNEGLPTKITAQVDRFRGGPAPGPVTTPNLGPSGLDFLDVAKSNHPPTELRDMLGDAVSAPPSAANPGASGSDLYGLAKSNHPPATPPPLRLNKSAAKQSLEDIIADVMNPERLTKYDSQGMELPPQLETAGEGALKQSGKFGKSGNLGQAGGYTSGRPGITEAQQDELLKKFGGGGGGPELPTRPPGGDVVQPPSSKFPPDGGQGDWHSGAESGSEDALMAHKLHPETRELDNLYQMKINDPLAALLMSLGIGAGAYGAQK